MAAPNNEEIYVNVLTFASGQDGRPVPLIFNETRGTPFLTNARAFKLAIMRFAVTLPQLPIWIPLIDQTASSPNDTVYYVGFAIAPCDDAQRVQSTIPIAGASVRVKWTPESDRYPAPKWPLPPQTSFLADDDSSRYYWATSTQKVLDVFNTAFAEAWISACNNANRYVSDNWNGAPLPKIVIPPGFDNEIRLYGTDALGNLLPNTEVAINVTEGVYSYEDFLTMLNTNLQGFQGQELPSYQNSTNPRAPPSTIRVNSVTASYVFAGGGPPPSNYLKFNFDVEVVNPTPPLTLPDGVFSFNVKFIVGFQNGGPLGFAGYTEFELDSHTDLSTGKAEMLLQSPSVIPTTTIPAAVVSWLCSPTAGVLPPAPKIVRTGTTTYSLAVDPWPFFPQIAPYDSYYGTDKVPYDIGNIYGYPQVYVILNEAAAAFLSGLPTSVNGSFISSSSLLQDPSGNNYWALQTGDFKNPLTPSQWDNSAVHIVNLNYESLTNVLPPISASAAQVPITDPSTILGNFAANGQNESYFPRLYPSGTTAFSTPVVYVDGYVNSSVGPLNGTSYAYVSNTTGYAFFPFERDPSDNWSPVDSIAFATPTLNAAPEVNSTPSIVNDDNAAAPSTSAAFANTFTDISLPLSGGAQDWKGKILYTPSGEFRRIDLTSAQPITVISFIVYWRCIINNSLYALRVAPGGSASLKLLFEKRMLARTA